MRRIQRCLGRGGRTGIRGKVVGIWILWSRLRVAWREKQHANFEKHVSAWNSCACDVPSHNYTWSFEPKLDWSAVYAGSREIFQYFNDFARKYALHKYVKVQHQVISAYWNHQKGGYNVTIKDLQSSQEISDHCDVLVNASGVLNNWRWPAIPDLDKYKGTLLHTANWDDNVNLAGRHVGLIGNG
jgi:cation diffusion facilitator CzcD-associated flavoprotein CzcO